MKPADAYRRLIESGPFDDPLVSWCATRWHWVAREGKQVLCCTPWRSVGKDYPEFIKPVV
ncbi:MAG: hypothetical protein EOO39_00025 [Cytophagaceae bacterium]|nr:MAG: hypothetical protein EOO39_00025 [Cytophagaceae bacterium]